MLQELMIRDFAIIDQLTVDFGTNMTVLTGETGAGKSIIIDALGLLAGGRGSSDFIRKGAMDVARFRIWKRRLKHVKKTDEASGK